MANMIYNLPGGITVERESTFGKFNNPHEPKGETPTPTPEPTPEPTPGPTPGPTPSPDPSREGEGDSPLVKAVKAVEEVVKPKRRGRPKKKAADSE